MKISFLKLLRGKVFTVRGEENCLTVRGGNFFYCAWSKIDHSKGTKPVYGEDRKFVTVRRGNW